LRCDRTERKALSYLHGLTACLCPGLDISIWTICQQTAGGLLASVVCPVMQLMTDLHEGRD